MDNGVGWWCCRILVFVAPWWTKFGTRRDNSSLVDTRQHLSTSRDYATVMRFLHCFDG